MYPRGKALKWPPEAVGFPNLHSDVRHKSQAPKNQFTAQSINPPLNTKRAACQLTVGPYFCWSAGTNGGSWKVGVCKD